MYVYKNQIEGFNALLYLLHNVRVKNTLSEPAARAGFDRAFLMEYN